MTRYRVLLAEEAEQDLLDIYEYVSVNDSQDKALYLLDQIEALCLSLDDLPERGHVPIELDRIGVNRYREVLFKPYRVLFEVREREVCIHCVVDGRRDMQAFLERRLLR